MTSRGRGDSLNGTEAEAIDFPPNFCVKSVATKRLGDDLNPTKAWGMKEIKTFFFGYSYQQLLNGPRDEIMSREEWEEVGYVASDHTLIEAMSWGK
jgi:hypothetical protein